MIWLAMISSNALKYRQRDMKRCLFLGFDRFLHHKNREVDTTFMVINYKVTRINESRCDWVKENEREG